MRRENKIKKVENKTFFIWVLKASDCTLGVPDDYISILEIIKSCSRQRRRTDQSSDSLEIDILRRGGGRKKMKEMLSKKEIRRSEK